MDSDAVAVQRAQILEHAVEQVQRDDHQTHQPQVVNDVGKSPAGFKEPVHEAGEVERVVLVHQPIVDGVGNAAEHAGRHEADHARHADRRDRAYVAQAIALHEIVQSLKFSGCHKTLRFFVRSAQKPPGAQVRPTVKA